MGYKRSAFRLCGTWCWIPHIAWGAMASYAALWHGVEGALLGVAMILVYIIYQFEETIVDMMTGNKEAAAWDWPEEELRELSVGIAIPIVIKILIGLGVIS